MGISWDIPGKHTKSYGQWSFVVSFPIKHGDVPCFLYVYQRVTDRTDININIKIHEHVKCVCPKAAR